MSVFNSPFRVPHDQMMGRISVEKIEKFRRARRYLLVNEVTVPNYPNR